MSETIGFIVIIVLYTVIGLMAAAGTSRVSKRIFAPRSEQIFYGLFLIMIAAFYLAFTAYFGMESAWTLESAAVLLFLLLGLLGTRVSWLLIIGYPLHGIWDILHELEAHADLSLFQSGRLTAIPLAYGIFCLAYDFS
ncbi:MAG TPA: DUF6010 family protein, partial [Acidobacteriota bacterium]|nr:DUF6010 family protein [Acidobacteriota bacterium]